MTTTLIILVSLVLTIQSLTILKWKSHKHILPPLTSSYRNYVDLRLPPQRQEADMGGYSYHKEYAEVVELYNNLVVECDAYKEAFEDQLKQFTDYINKRVGDDEKLPDDSQ